MFYSGPLCRAALETAARVRARHLPAVQGDSAARLEPVLTPAGYCASGCFIPRSQPSLASCHPLSPTAPWLRLAFGYPSREKQFPPCSHLHDISLCCCFSWSVPAPRGPSLCGAGEGVTPGAGQNFTQLLCEKLNIIAISLINKRFRILQSSWELILMSKVKETAILCLTSFI